MHQRTWLSLLTLPLVATFSYPVVLSPAREAAPQASARSVTADPLAGLADIQDVLTLVRDNYVENPDMEKVIAGGIREALERAHPLNAYLSPEDLRLGDPGPAGPGLRLIKRGIYAQVVAVNPGGPAARAGFVVGDVVRKLDGNSVGPLSAWTLERRLQGAPGSEIALLRYGTATGETRKIVLKRELPQHPPISVRKDPKATLLVLPDLAPGRAAELKGLLAGLDHQLPLVLDLRQCSGGSLSETALAAGLFVGAGPLGAIQVTGQPEQPLAVVPAGLPPFARLGVLQGPGTLGPAELFVSALKRQAVPLFGERTAGLCVERTRFLLKSGGAAEVVNKRWMGAGGEYLGAGGEKPEAMKAAAEAKAADSKTKEPQSQGPKAPGAEGSKASPLGFGVQPDHPLKGLKPEEDPLPRILEGFAEAPRKNAVLPQERNFSRRSAQLICPGQDRA